MKSIQFKKLMAIFLAVTVILLSFPLGIIAFAAGDGTENNPYQISTAAQLQNINNNIEAHYKLVNDINLNGVDFTPIGNADSGAFCGSFDGSGYTISGLKVFAGKYAALFGCNEGIIKNVKLASFSIYGRKYTAGVVAYNSEIGTIINCQLYNGNIESENSVNYLYTGGICGINKGMLEGSFKNNAEISISANERGYYYIGGLIGLNCKECTLTGINNGTITANCGFYDNSDSWSYSFKSDARLFIGGIIGNSQAKISLIECANNGAIICYKGSITIMGGLIGFANSANITNSYNSGIINVENFNGNHMRSEANGGSLIGAVNTKLMITNSYNTRNIIINSDRRVAAFTSWDSSTDQSFINCYNIGNIYASGSGNNGLYGDDNAKVVSTYNTHSQYLETSYGTCLPYGKYSEKSSYENWDFETEWDINMQLNSGFPVLRNNCAELMLNESSRTMVSGERLQLYAYQNGIMTNDVNWSVTKGDATITKNGLLIAAPGFSTITATDSSGNKANCNIYVMSKNSSAGVDSITAKQGSSVSGYIHFAASDLLTNVYSSDDSVYSINTFNDNYYYGTANTAGTAIMHFETIQGIKGSCTVTVTNTATKVSITDYTSSISRGKSYQFKALTSPNPSSSTLSWISSDESVATVDGGGLVTAVGIGSCRITVSTDNGYSAYKDITVTAPITSMEFEHPFLTLYKGDMQKLNLIYSPIDTTDSISYSVTNSSTSGGLSVDSSGNITAKQAGTYKVRAWSSYGVEAYCNVTVKDIPVIVEDVSIDQSEKDIRVGEVFKLTATVSPSNATDSTVTWASTDESVASVSSGGMVEAKGAGKAVITATSSNGIIAACEVNVSGMASINRAKLYIPNVISTTEGIVEVPVMIENNPGISFASYNVRYNPEAVEPIDVSNGDLFDAVLGSIESDENQVKLYFTSADTIKEDGILANIRFRILDDEKPADIKLAYYPGNIREGEQNAVSLNLVEGFVDLTYYPPYSLTYTCPKFSGRESTLILSNGKTQYTSESSNGVFYIDSSILGGTYNIYIKPRYGLTTLLENKFTFGSATLQSVEIESHSSPILGDINEDDVIDIADLSMFLSTANYGKTNTEIDLTGDGMITIDDIAVALQEQNYGKSSVKVV